MNLIDLHLDLAMNAMEWNRDLRWPLEQIRLSEKDLHDKPDRARGTVCFETLKKAGAELVVATQIARYVQPGSRLSGWHSPEQAWAQTQAQLAWYKAMQEDGWLLPVLSKETLSQFFRQRKSGAADFSIGYILSLEGADSLITLDHLHLAFGYGLRAIGPAHYGPGRYANGTDSEGKMGAMGISLLREMDQLGMILDMTHLCDDAFWQALEIYTGPIWASHNLCRSLVPHNRQYSDDQLRALIDRKAVIGAAMDAWMIVPGWQRGISTPESMNCTLNKVIDHIDHICQLAGNGLHVCIGSDLDGAYGNEQTPADLEQYGDLQKFPVLLQARGYSAADVEAIMFGNAKRFLERSLP